MNLTQTIDMLDKSKNKQGTIPKRKFNTLFEIIPAGDDGNCLFYSVEQLDSQFDYEGLRNSVCNYYKKFHEHDEYDENSIKYRLQMQMIADDDEHDGTLHQDNICNDLEWAGIMDVISLTDILKLNIILMLMNSSGYTVQPFIYNQRAKTIFIKYNGINHFEPLLPKFDIQTTHEISSSRKKSSSSQTYKTKKTYLDDAKSVSSETRKLIENLETGKKKGLPKKTTAKGTNKRHKSRKMKRN
jgi:hypothetical protein